MHVGLDSSHPCCPCTRKQMTSASHWHHSLAQHSAVIKNVLWFVNWIRSTSAFLVLWEDGAAPGRSRAFHRSQDAHGHRKALSWDTLGFAALSASGLDEKTWSPGVETEIPPWDNRGKNNEETAPGRDGNIQAKDFCVTQAASQARRETRASLCTPKPAGQRTQQSTGQN